MYLSKVFIPWRQARNPYQTHRLLWRLFPKRPNDTRDFLFRVEKQKKGLGMDILMQSLQEPLQSDTSCHITAVRDYNLILKNEQQFRFRLRANPVKTITDEKGRTNRKGELKKCRVPIICEEDQHAWIERKLKGSVTIQALEIQREIPLYFRKPKARRAGKIQTVIFDGSLKIDNSEVLIETIKSGVGPAKAFGCGLLSLARV